MVFTGHRGDMSYTAVCGIRCTEGLMNGLYYKTFIDSLWKRYYISKNNILKRYILEDNFRDILKKYGQIISNFNEIDSKMYYSCIKISILMKNNLKYNKKIRISASGKIINVAIVEFEYQY